MLIHGVDALVLMTHAHYTGLEPGQGHRPGPGWTQIEKNGSLSLSCPCPHVVCTVRNPSFPVPVPTPCPGPVHCVWAITEGSYVADWNKAPSIIQGTFISNAYYIAYENINFPQNLWRELLNNKGHNNWNSNLSFGLKRIKLHAMNNVLLIWLPGVEWHRIYSPAKKRENVCKCRKDKCLLL